MSAAQRVAAAAARDTQVTDNVDEVPRSDLPLYIGIAAVALVLVGMTIAAVSRGSSTKKPAAAPAIVAQAAQPGQPAEAIAPGNKKEVEIVLRTIPPGADIFDRMERLGASPLSLRRARSDAQ